MTPDAETLAMLDTLCKQHTGPLTVELLRGMLALRLREEQLVHALAVRTDPVSCQIFSVMCQHNPALAELYPQQLGRALPPPGEGAQAPGMWHTAFGLHHHQAAIRCGTVEASAFEVVRQGTVIVDRIVPT